MGEKAVMRAGHVRVGISGWRYPPWRSHFYPKGLPQQQELSFASRMLPSIEINGSFYSLQRPASYLQWHDATPEGFVFTVKGPRYITHMRRLKDVGTPLANFLASGLFALGRKLGPILWQFPPQLQFDAARFSAFFDMLPEKPACAAALARTHDSRMDGRTFLDASAIERMRHAVEVRHDSFVHPDFIALLRRHRIALVIADSAGRWPSMEDLTADFVYIRLHGDEELYASGYGDEALDRWAARIDTWRSGGQVADARLASPVAPARRAKRDVYCYFDNDVKLHAPYDAAALAARLGVPTGMGTDRRFAVPPGLGEPRRRSPPFGRRETASPARTRASPRRGRTASPSATLDAMPGPQAPRHRR
jgi:uncharacterized protein YecE (DUF72 family)